MKRRSKTLALFLAMTIAVSSVSTAFAIPSDPLLQTSGEYNSQYDGTWKSLALINDPKTPVPPAYCADEVYEASALGLLYLSEYNPKTDTLTPKWRSWTAPVTRDDFSEYMYHALTFSAQTSWDVWGLNDPIANGGWTPEFTDLIKKLYLDVSLRWYYNNNQSLEADEAAYNKYKAKGGKLAYLEWRMYIHQYETNTSDGGKRLYYFKDTVNRYTETLVFTGALKPDSTNNFYPNRLITRQDAAVMVDGVLKTLGIYADNKPAAKFADDSSISASAKDSVYRVSGYLYKGKSIFPGISGNNFNPNKGITYADAATIAARIFESNHGYFMTHVDKKYLNR